jgi:tripartite-type tricarboxylate transporter receptor subunit TctC
MRIVLRVLACLVLAASVFPAFAQGYPARLVKIVVPFPPGGSTDLLARRIAEKFQQSMGQPFIVENRPGAGGVVGSEMVAKSPADGYTLLVGVTGSHSISPSLNPAVSYDPLKSFEPISVIVSGPLVLVVNPDLPARDVKSLVALAKSGRALNYGTPGNGTSMHLATEMFNAAAGIQLTHVPYKGSANAMTDLIGGQIQVMVNDMVVTLPQIRAGKVRALAVTSSRRHPLLPDVPTVAESGYPGFEALSWQGMFAPAGTPRDVLAKLNTELVKALQASDLQEQFGSQGFFVGGDSPAEFRAFIEKDIARWAQVIRTAGIKPQ